MNGTKVLKPAKQVASGDVVAVATIPPKPHATANESATIIDVPVLYEDRSCLVINKPAGIAVHPGIATGNAPTIIEVLRGEYGSGLHLVHRLDKETTGCLLCAKNTAALEALQRQFQERSVQKSYLAIVAGIPSEKRAMIDAPIGRSLVNRVKMSLFKTGESREARTSYEVLDSAGNASLLRCDIHTGRTHQIRVHLSAIRHPIFGDTKYGSAESIRVAKEHGVEGLCLHARTLAFTSPEGVPVTIAAPIPESFRMNTEKLHLRIPEA